MKLFQWGRAEVPRSVRQDIEEKKDENQILRVMKLN